MSSISKNQNISMFVGLLVVMVDQVSKVFFSSQILNQGVAFGLGQNMAWEIVSLFLLVMVFYMYLVAKKDMEKMGLILIFASGLSNLIDRLFIGGVRDFIFWPVLNVYGNVADVFLVFGVCIITFDNLRSKNFQ